MSQNTRITIGLEKLTNTLANADGTTGDAPTAHRVGALLPMPSCLGIGGHTGGSRQGHPQYTSARTVGRPWVARDTLHATPPQRQDQGYHATLWLPTLCVAVLCPLWCTHVKVLLFVMSYVVFHPLTSLEVMRHAIFENFRDFQILTRNYPTRFWRAQKASVRYRQKSNPPQHPAFTLYI